MAVILQQNPAPALVETVEEIMTLFKSLPRRPSSEEIEAAVTVLKSLNSEEKTKLEEISSQSPPLEVPPELFSVLQQVKKSMILYQSHEQRKEALYLLEVDEMFQKFDELIQRASELIFAEAQKEKGEGFGDSGRRWGLISDESLVKEKANEELREDGLEFSGRRDPIKASSFSGEIPEKLSLMEVATLIESSAKTREVVLDLQGKLMEKIEWLPVSLGKLSDITELNLSENHLMALPETIASLKALKKLDLHSNQLINLPDLFGELINLTDLDLHANKLKSLPVSFGKMTNLSTLDLSSNHFTHLPLSIGNLTSLKKLTAETNDLEEIPYTIGSCTSLVELRLDFNQLKALPEAIGKLERLEILTLHYNKVKALPTTVGALSNLRELDLSFNELESVPENLCFAVNLKVLNVGKNFADLTALPRSIGNLEMLEELDISDDQIRVLPDSFMFLSKLRVFRADETPLEVPPREVVKLGAQAVVKHMANLVNKNRESKFVPSKRRKGFWFWLCSLFCTRQRVTTRSIESLNV